MVQEADAAHLRLQQEMGESEGRFCATLCLLQFLPDSRFAEGYASDGSRSSGKNLDYR